MSKTSKVSYPQYLGYGVGALGLDLSYGLFYTFLSIYLTDTLYISSAFLLVVSFLARVFDGITDPVMGAIVDGTKSRFGKYRPWIITGAFTNAIVLAMLFTNPGFAVGGTGLYAYAAAMYVLWGMTNTLMDIPYWSMVPSLTTDPKQRNIAATIPRAFSGLGQLVIIVATPKMLTLLGRPGDADAQGFQRWACVCGIALVCLVAISFFSTGRIKAVTQTKPSQIKITPRSVLDTLRKNDQLLVFMLVALLANTGWYLVNGLAPYYFKQVVGDFELLSTFGMLAGAAQAAGLVMLPVLTRKLRRNSVIKLAMAMAAGGYLGMYFFRGFFPLFAVFGFVGMMGVGCSFVSQTVMLSDIVDYGEYKLGYRSDSVVFSMKGFLQKGAYSLQSIVMFACLQLTGYKGELAIQPAAAQQGITVMMFLIPPALTMLALLLFSSKYKLDEEKMAEINA